MEERNKDLDEDISRKGNNLHNFTTLGVDCMIQKMLDKNGGFVPIYNEEISDYKLWLQNAEKALLLFTLVVTGQKGRKKLLSKKTVQNKNDKSGMRWKTSRKYNHVRNEIRANLSHPNLSKANRDYIYSTLKLIDRLQIKSYRSFRTQSKSENLNVVPNETLNHLRNFSRVQEYAIRESDKKLGWALNSVNWYEREYRRHLDSDFYCWVGKIQDAGDIKVKCREELKDIVNK